MAQPLFCTRCFKVAPPKTHTRGSFIIELFLWLCFLVPGLIYSLWRLTTRQKVCPACESPELVPANSERARMMTAGGTPQWGPPR
jgi:hypothetical protein